MSRSHGTRRRGGRWQQSSDRMACDPEIVSEVEELFNKVKTYAKPSTGEWSIPDPNDSLRCLPQENSCLQALKESLNAVKNQLSDKNLEIWHQHTNSTNRAGKVIAAVRSAANAEICTQAWCKFYEILGTFDLLPEEALRNGELNTVHLCEAPGAFITALNHHIKTSERTRYCDWSWAANTLNPYHEGNAGNTTIADDRLIANTLPWWFFGSDNTGNIMNQKHLLELQTFVSNMHSVDVVTADGSFDCQENPDEQEALVASLQYCEATAALLLLSPGGSFVLKMFTLYEHSSICLIYLLNCCFRTVNIFKPATSKAGNSEVYVVCLHYDGKEAVRPLLSKLIRNYGPCLANREALFPNALLPPSFLEQHEQVCSYFHRLQVETINENLRLFEDMSVQQRQRLDVIRDYAAQEYLQRLQVSCLPRARWLSRNTVNPACCSVTGGRPLDQRKQLGTFNERRELLTLSWRERIERGCLASWIQGHCTEDIWKGCVLEGPLANCHVHSWYIIMGDGLTTVRNSPFCEGGLLSHLNEALLQTAQSSEVASTPMLPCDSCQVVCATSILAEVAGLCDSSSPDDDNAKTQCLIFGSESVWGACGGQIGDLVIKVSAEPSSPVTSRITLHDGDPQYQQELLGCVLYSMRNLHPGDALLLPVFSALTRVTAAIVLCLHLSFRTVTFSCPPPVGVVGTVLVCAGFCPEVAAQLLPWLTDLHDCMGRLAREEDADNKSSECRRQVLQFVPMEELLRLTEFLCTMNSAIVRYKLHLLMQT